MPPPAARPERETTDTTIGGDRVLTKLRTLTDPVMAESSGIRGGMRSTGMKLAQPSGKPTTVPAASLPERGTYQTKVQSHMNSTMEMMAQTVVDPKTGETTYVFSCFNQDQPLDQVDFPALAQRLAQNGVQEKLTALWIDRCLKLLPPPAEKKAA